MDASDTSFTPSSDGQIASVRRQALTDEEFDDLVTRSSLSTSAAKAIALSCPPAEVMEVLRQAAALEEGRKLRHRDCGRRPR